MINLLKRLLNPSTIEKKLAIIVSFIIVIIITTFCFLSFLIIKSRYEDMLYRSLATSASLITQELSNDLNNVVLLSDAIRSDPAIQKSLDIIYENDEYRTEKPYDNLYLIQQSYFQRYKKKYLAYSAIINPKFISYTYGYGYNKLSEQMVAELEVAAEQKNGGPVWFSKYTNKHYLFLVRQIKKIENLSLDNLGTLSIAIDMDSLLNKITQESKTFQQINWIFYENDKLLYSSLQLDDISLSNLAKFSNSYGPVTINGHRYFGLRGYLTELDWNYFQLIPYDDMAHAQSSLLRFYFILFLISIILTIFLIHLSIQRITSDIGILFRKMKSFRGDNIDAITVPYSYSERTDEIGLLHQYFDSMAKEIETLINSDYKLKLDMKSMQLKSLESQINPHFLYNTLESINWRAKATGNTEISQMAESLGSLLRSTLSNKESLIPLSEELSLVQSYLTIQKIRYEGRLIYSFYIDDNLLTLSILPLSIQPLVENAIKYGLEEMLEECHIYISVQLTPENNLLIKVKNNGSSFEEDLLEKLQTAKTTVHGFGIGLININQRIHLLFGPNYGVALSNENEFAVASFLIPIYSKGEPLC